MRVNYSIVFVSDMASSVIFYRDVLGMPLKFETPEWSEFMTDGATLALHRSGSETSADADHESGTCRPGFQVPDLNHFHQRMILNDVPCKQEPTTTFGVRIAQYADPDGLTFSVSEAHGD